LAKGTPGQRPETANLVDDAICTLSQERAAEETPVTAVNEKLTYHDRCFLGRHNKVFTPPRVILEAVEERIGKRINTERIDEALDPDPDTISTTCPYCLVMLGDAVAAKKGSGETKDSIEVIDVAQLLVRSVALKAASPNGADTDAD
jgi:Fe-S oxidoreductase